MQRDGVETHESGEGDAFAFRFNHTRPDYMFVYALTNSAHWINSEQERQSCAPFHNPICQSGVIATR